MKKASHNRIKIQGKYAGRSRLESSEISEHCVCKRINSSRWVVFLACLPYLLPILTGLLTDLTRTPCSPTVSISFLISPYPYHSSCMRYCPDEGSSILRNVAINPLNYLASHRPHANFNIRSRKNLNFQLLLLWGVHNKHSSRVRERINTGDR